MNIYFDKRVELIFGLVYTVYRKNNVDNYEYITTFEDYCNDFYDKFFEIIPVDFEKFVLDGNLGNYQKTLLIALSLNEKYNVKNNILDKNNIKLDVEKLEKFLQDIIKKSNYEDFIKEKEKFYKNISDSYSKNLNKYIKFNSSVFSKFYGYDKNINTILLFNFKRGGFGITIEDKSLIATSVLNHKIQDNEIRFISGEVTHCFHEGTHIYMKDFVNKDLSKYSFKKLYEEAKRNGLAESYNCDEEYWLLLDEYITRAAELYFGSLIFGEEAKEKIAKKEISKGFIYIEEISDLFNLKNKFNTFKEFFDSKLLSFFIDKNKK